MVGQTRGIAPFVVFRQPTSIFPTIVVSLDRFSMIVVSLDDCGRASWHGLTSPTFFQALGSWDHDENVPHWWSNMPRVHCAMKLRELPPLSSSARDSCFRLKSSMSLHPWSLWLPQWPKHFSSRKFLRSVLFITPMKPGWSRISNFWLVHLTWSQCVLHHFSTIVVLTRWDHNIFLWCGIVQRYLKLFHLGSYSYVGMCNSVYLEPCLLWHEAWKYLASLSGDQDVRGRGVAGSLDLISWLLLVFRKISTYDWDPHASDRWLLVEDSLAYLIKGWNALSIHI